MKKSLSIAFLSLLCLFLDARELKFAWNPNPEPDVIGYRLHWGEESGRYSTSINVGDVTTAAIEVPNIDIYTVVTAYNAAGLESFPSNEVYVGQVRYEWIREFNNNYDLDGDGELDGLQYCLYTALEPSEYPEIDFNDPFLVIVWEYSTDLFNWTEGARGPLHRALTMVRPKKEREFFRWRVIDTSGLH